MSRGPIASNAPLSPQSSSSSSSSSSSPTSTVLVSEGHEKTGHNAFVSFFHHHLERRKRPVSDARREADIIYDSTVAKLGELYKNNYNIHVAADKLMTLSDFEGLKTIGTGSFGTVKVAKLKETGEVYAIKILGKHRIVRANQVEHTMSEKRILRSMDFPFIVRAVKHFWDNANLFMVLEYCAGGELFKLLQKYHCFKEPMARFYGAQVVMAFEFLHKIGVIYRDLKPENILIDSTGYIKLVDFGLAKETRASTHTLCGTPDYLAPEMLRNEGYDKSIDWWALGVLLYELVAGYIPFYAGSKMESYFQILTKKVYIPLKFSKEMSDLIRHLLDKDPKSRLGCTKNGAYDVKYHSWFADVNWLEMFEKKVPPPYVPLLKDSMDTSNFEEYEEIELDSAPFCVYYNKFADFY